MFQRFGIAARFNVKTNTVDTTQMTWALNTDPSSVIISVGRYACLFMVSLKTFALFTAVGLEAWYAKTFFENKSVAVIIILYLHWVVILEICLFAWHPPVPFPIRWRWELQVVFSCFCFVCLSCKFHIVASNFIHYWQLMVSSICVVFFASFGKCLGVCLPYHTKTLRVW